MLLISILLESSPNSQYLQVRLNDSGVTNQNYALLDKYIVLQGPDEHVERAMDILRSGAIHEQAGAGIVNREEW